MNNLNDGRKRTPQQMKISGVALAGGMATAPMGDDHTSAIDDREKKPTQSLSLVAAMRAVSPLMTAAAAQA